MRASSGAREAACLGAAPVQRLQGLPGVFAVCAWHMAGAQGASDLVPRASQSRRARCRCPAGAPQRLWQAAVRGTWWPRLAAATWLSTSLRCRTLKRQLLYSSTCRLGRCEHRGAPTRFAHPADPADPQLPARMLLRVAHVLRRAASSTRAGQMGSGHGPEHQEHVQVLSCAALRLREGGRTSPMRSACQGMIQKLSGIHSEHTAAHTIMMLRKAALLARCTSAPACSSQGCSGWAQARAAPASASAGWARWARPAAHAWCGRQDLQRPMRYTGN